MNLREYLREHGADHCTRPLREEWELREEMGGEDYVESDQ